jgi:hypothetical protein
MVSQRHGRAGHERSLQRVRDFHNLRMAFVPRTLHGLSTREVPGLFRIERDGGEASGCCNCGGGKCAGHAGRSARYPRDSAVPAEGGIRLSLAARGERMRTAVGAGGRAARRNAHAGRFPDAAVACEEVGQRSILSALEWIEVAAGVRFQKQAIRWLVDHAAAGHGIIASRHTAGRSLRSEAGGGR